MTKKNQLTQQPLQTLIIPLQNETGNLLDPYCLTLREEEEEHIDIYMEITRVPTTSLSPLRYNEVRPLKQRFWYHSI